MKAALTKRTALRLLSPLVMLCTGAESARLDVR